MNKLIIIPGIVILCAGCAANPPPVVAPAPVVPPKAEVIEVINVQKDHNEHKQASTSIDVYPGSLKENIERIASHYGWRQVVWDAPEDYRWVGKAHIKGENLEGILSKLLADY